jgi:hypothetical protein
MRRGTRICAQKKNGWRYYSPRYHNGLGSPGAAPSQSGGTQPGRRTHYGCPVDAARIRQPWHLLSGLVYSRSHRLVPALRYAATAYLLRTLTTLIAPGLRC